MADDFEVDILLATRDSVPFLREQLDSIFSQTFEDWRLNVYDDGSTDATRFTVRQLAAEHPGTVELLEDDGGCGGPVKGFSALLARSTAPYVMFCDHDDVWKPQKIAVSLERMNRLECELPPETPILVFTDLEVTDRELQTIGTSYWKVQRIDPYRLQFRQLLTQNVPCGCTMILNRALVDLTAPIPPRAVMHDHWVSLVAAALGRIEYLDEATLLYRQHGGNTMGAAGGSWRRLLARAMTDPVALRTRFYQNVEQARAFLERFGSRLRLSDRKAVAAFAALREQSFLSRRVTLLRYGILKSGLARNLGTLAIM